MKSLVMKVLSLFRKEPKPSFIVEVMRDEDWETVAMSFATHQAGVDYAKQNYSTSWQYGRVRVRPL